MGRKERVKKKAARRNAPDQRTKGSLSDKKSKADRKVPGKNAKKTEIGREVVRKVCGQLTNARIFPTLDASVLERVAKYESNFGKDKAYIKGSAPVGGIWRVTRTGFEDSRDLYAHPELEEYFIRMFKAFRVNWSKVEWKRDMDIPLYSGLAAGLLIIICTPGLFPRGPGGKLVIEQEDVLQGLYYSSANKNYDGVFAVKARKTKAIAPGMMCQGNKKKSSKKTSFLFSKADLPVTTCGRNALSKSRKTDTAAKSNKRSGNTDPVTGRLVRGADDFFVNDFRGAVGVRGGQKDRERRWNSGIGEQGKGTRAVSGKCERHGGQRGGGDTSKKTSFQFSKADLPVTTCGKNALSKSRKTDTAAKSNKRFGNTDPVTGRLVRGADDFFVNDFRGAVGVRRGQKDRERRWNSGIGEQGKGTHAVSGKSERRGGQRGGGDTRDRAQHGMHQHQPRSGGALGRPVRPAIGGNHGVRQGGTSARPQQRVLEQNPKPAKGATQNHPQGRSRTINDKQPGARNSHHDEMSPATADRHPNHPVLEPEKLKDANMAHTKHQGHGNAGEHDHFTSDISESELEALVFGSDTDVTHSISDSDLCGLSALDETSHDEEVDDRSNESEEDGNGSCGGQEHSEDIYDSVASEDDEDYSAELSNGDESDVNDGSHSDDSFDYSEEDDEDDSAELSNGDESDVNDESHSDDSFDDSEDDEDDSAELSSENESDVNDGSHSGDSFDDSENDEEEEDPDHVYDDPSSDDSECTDEASDRRGQESEEHIYEDPADLLESDEHIYANTVDLLEPIYEDPDDLLDD